MRAVSNSTNSRLSAPIGHHLRNRATQVSTLSRRLRNEGGSQPLGLRRLLNLGLRYLVCRDRRDRRAARRLTSASRTSSPRWASSAAHSTSPVVSLTTASPVVLLPGSILARSGEHMGSGLVSFKMSTKGKRRNTAALCCFKSKRARAGVQGCSGLFWASTTKTRDIDSPSKCLVMRRRCQQVKDPPASKVVLVKVIERFRVFAARIVP